MLRIYSNLLLTRPLLTKVVTSSLVLATGDTGTQFLVEGCRLQELDSKRILKFAGLGGLMVAPSLHFWYAALAKRFPSKQQVFLRVLADQLLFTPVFLFSFLFVNRTIDFGISSYRSSTVKVLEDLPQTLVLNWLLWFPFQSFNFYFVPLHFQVLANNACAVFWNGYLSWQIHQKPHKSENQ